MEQFHVYSACQIDSPFMRTSEIRRTNGLSNWILQTSFASVIPDNFIGVLEGSFLQRIISCP